ncbi:VENN motif pre-toxin domain-containing protein, partial [Formosimonas limnophila]|uniref:VENN motif pre-toxin domain-containing protein n=1 Tax=Formosimonas limnophila TaxID=1384487 RepID=UPI001677D5E7
AASGAAGAVTGEALAQIIIKEKYDGKTSDQLTTAEKEDIRAISTLAATLVGGISGGSFEDAVTAGAAGYNAVVNNKLSELDIPGFIQKLVGNRMKCESGQLSDSACAMLQSTAERQFKENNCSTNAESYLCSSLSREIKALDEATMNYQLSNRMQLTWLQRTNPIRYEAVKEVIDQGAVIYPPLRMISGGLTIGEIVVDVVAKHDFRSATKEFAISMISEAMVRRVPMLNTLPTNQRDSAQEGIKYIAGKLYDQGFGK